MTLIRWWWGPLMIGLIEFVFSHTPLSYDLMYNSCTVNSAGFSPSKFRPLPLCPFPSFPPSLPSHPFLFPLPLFTAKWPP